MAHNTQYYLDDEVINDYFKLIENRDPSVYCFDTFFYLNYKSHGYQRVKRWTKNVDIFSKKKLFFPIHIKRRNFLHWILVVADIEKQQVISYDSLRRNRDSSEYYRDGVFEYLAQEHQAKLHTFLPVDEWERVRGDNPYQQNGIDCGAYVCAFAEYLSRDAAFNFGHNNMPSVKKLIAYELCTLQLISIDVGESDIDEEINRVTNNN